MNDDDLKRQADSDWIDHTDSPYERYLELKLARAVKQRDNLLAACAKLLAYRQRVGPISFQLEKADDYFRLIGAAVETVKESEPA